nr:MAG TPA: hypothetical protein [Caudoviricetes sp.]DAH06009.1 MAG TPA: hypothetical protein [Caudoviricetes sp.]
MQSRTMRKQQDDIKRPYGLFILQLVTEPLALFN